MNPRSVLYYQYIASRRWVDFLERKSRFFEYFYHTTSYKAWRNGNLSPYTKRPELKIKSLLKR